MTGERSHLPQAPNASTPSAWKRWAFTAFVGAQALFIGYLIAGALRDGGEWRPWYLLAAGGLSLIVGIVAWSRLRPSFTRR